MLKSKKVRYSFCTCIENIRFVNVDSHLVAHVFCFYAGKSGADEEERV